VSELPPGIHPAEVPRPRESASAIVLRHDEAGECEILLGLRSRRSRFMPSHLAFPGGGLESIDRPDEDGAHQRCVARELLEETGIEIPDGQWTAAGERTTPPMFPVRFRTLFFVAWLPRSVEEVAPANAENERLSFSRPRDVLIEWREGRVKLPPPVLAILRDLAETATERLDEIATQIAATNAIEERAPRIEFAPDLWVLPVHTPTLPPATHTNVWMPGGRRFVVIDPGSDDDVELQRLFDVIARRREAGSEPAAVVLTHEHRDHTGGAAAVARQLGLPLRAHPTTLSALAADLSGVDVAALCDGDEIDLGGLALNVHGTPGHAAGHLAFFAPERRWLVAGDLVSGMSTILVDPASGDMGRYLESLDRMRALDGSLLLPGHGPPLPYSQLGRVIEHRRDREARVRETVAAEAVELAEIARRVYADAPQMPPVLTELQSLAHLLLLERDGAVERVDPHGGSWRRR